MPQDPYLLQVPRRFQLWKVAVSNMNALTHCVQITRDLTGGTIAVVADGFCLVVVPVRWMEDREPSDDVLIDIGCVKAAKGESIILDVEAGTSRVGTCQWDLPQIIFPEWRQLIPARPYSAPRMQMQLDPAMQHRVMLATDGAHRVAASNDGHGPAIVYSSETIALIAPMSEILELDALQARLSVLQTKPEDVEKEGN